MPVILTILASSFWELLQIVIRYCDIDCYPDLLSLNIHKMISVALATNHETNQ
jgi:hypothetical protein